MRIKKMYQGTVPENKILDTYSDSATDTYSCNYVNGIAGKVLWTNANPTSSFGTNTITLSSNDYDFLEFICIYVSSNTDITFSQKTIKGKGLVASAYHSGNNVTRIFDYTDETHYTSRHGFLGANQDDTRVVPLYVIGYKTGTFS